MGSAILIVSRPDEQPARADLVRMKKHPRENRFLALEIRFGKCVASRAEGVSASQSARS